MLDIKVYELLPVFFGYIFIFATLNKFNSCRFSKNLIIDCERSSQDVFKRCFVLVVENILETLGDLWLPKLKIIKAWMLTQEKLVAHGVDWNIQDDLMPRSKSQQSSDQLKINVRLISLIVEPIQPGVWIVHEHAIVSIKQLLENKLKVFLLDSSLIDCWLVMELNLERLS